jgi:hypothetical protein
MVNILIGLVMVIGGMSGHLGIRGISNSGTGLAILGGVLIVWGGIQMFNPSDEE